MFIFRFALMRLFAFAVLASLAVRADPVKSVDCGGDTDVPMERQNVTTTRRVAEEVRAVTSKGQGARFNFQVRHNNPKAVLHRLHGEREPMLNKRNLDFQVRHNDPKAALHVLPDVQ